MQRTDNFDLIVVEGSDTVNLLTQMNPNTEVIDEQMFKNQNAGVQTATELLSGTVHAITRSVPDASMIRFTAVSRFTAGDTFTVDGVQVSALLPSGEQLPDGAFIIGSEVLCVLKGTLLTVFASGGAVALAKNAEKLGGQLPSYYATKAEVDSAQETANSAGALTESNSLDIADIKNRMIALPDYNNVIHTLSQNTAYTAESNCWLIGNFGATDTTNRVLINSVDVIRAYSGSSSVRDNVSICVPLKAGDVVMCDSRFINLKVYGVLTD